MVCATACASPARAGFGVTVCMALTQVFAPDAARVQQVVGWRGAQVVTRAQFVAQVHAWCAAFRRVPGPVVALYFEDALVAHIRQRLPGL